jgi:hypothetical protein
MPGYRGALFPQCSALSSNTILFSTSHGEWNCLCIDLSCERIRTFSWEFFPRSPMTLCKKGFEIDCSCQRASGGTPVRILHNFGRRDGILGPTESWPIFAALENAFLICLKGTDIKPFSRQVWIHHRFSVFAQWYLRTLRPSLRSPVEPGFSSAG